MSPRPVATTGDAVVDLRPAAGRAAEPAAISDRRQNTVGEVRAKLPVLRAVGAGDYIFAPYERMPQVSFFREMMGDDAVAIMQFSEFVPAEKQAEFRNWFPEAEFEWPSEPDYLRSEMENVLGPISNWPTKPFAPPPGGDPFE